MAIGTQNGIIKVFGQPGVEFYGNLSFQYDSNNYEIQILDFVHDTGLIISLSHINHLILWEPKEEELVAINSKNFEDSLGNISSICSSMFNNSVWIGTENGFVYELNVYTFELKSHSLTPDEINQR